MGRRRGAHFSVFEAQPRVAQFPMCDSLGFSASVCGHSLILGTAEMWRTSCPSFNFLTQSLLRSEYLRYDDYYGCKFARASTLSTAWPRTPEASRLLCVC